MTFTEHRVDLPDGRVLALTDRGPAAGPVVLLLHSSPGSRLLDPDPAATVAAGVRLLTVDRPGAGDSTAVPASCVPSLDAVADDVAHALRALAVGPVAAVGWSAGGRVALALAARHPGLVRSVALVGTPAPDDEVPWLPAEHRELVAVMRADPTSALATLLGVFGGAGTSDDAAPGDAAPGDAVHMVAAGPSDDRLLTDPDVRQRLDAMMAAAFAQGPAGVAADIVAANVAPVGHRMRDVRGPVALFSGADDPVVPPIHAAWWKGQLPHATDVVVPDAGHLLVVPAWAQVLRAIA